VYSCVSDAVRTSCFLLRLAQVRCKFDLRREKPSRACQYGNENLIMLRNLEQCARKLVVVFSAQRIELLGHVERDDGDAAAVVDEDGVFL
jgi:hypothetical protein